MKKSGFTLIDLMLALALIGIVLSIIIPAVKGKPDTSLEAAQCEAKGGTLLDNGVCVRMERIP
jgi:prepilin-type N-terminal cleavage/methylation domain-containing protein